MLINAQRPEQLRLAIVDGKSLEDYQVDIKEAGLTRGNIYRGVVANIQPSLNAAFIDLGEERHGFLSADDVLPHAYHHQPPEGVRRPRIDQILERRRQIDVQVTKDGLGHKGPALNTNLAIAGRYLVLMPHDEVRAISRKAESGDDREKVRERLEKLKLPDGHGVIVRTNGLEQNQTTLNRDLSALLRLWGRIEEAGRQAKGAKLLYSDQDLLMQALRDYLDSSMTEVVVDSDEAYEKASSYMRAFMPRSKTRLLRYRERIPLFSRYQLEQHIDRIYERQVPLPSGGSIVIDGTEALTAIDVNSGRATKNADHEESIFNVNLEAADEVARQLRLRDIGGLVVIDFIDMRLRKHQRKLEKVMRDAMKVDKARHSVSRISANGLVEINRQRIKQALRQRTHRACPVCSGVGSVPSAEFSAQSVLRRIETRAASGLVEAVTVALHPEIADSLQNRYRRELAQLESDFEMHVEVLATPTFGRSEERIDWTARERKAGPVAILSADDLLSSVKTRKRGGRGRKKTIDEKVRDEPAVEASSDDQEQDKPAKPARKRSRRRGRKPATAEAKDGAQSADSATKDGKEGSAPSRRPRGRDSESQEAGDLSSDPAAETRSRRDGANGDDGEGAPKPKRRRGKRGGRGRRKKVETGDTLDSSSNNDTRQNTSGSGQDSAAADFGWRPSTTDDVPPAEPSSFFRESSLRGPQARGRSAANEPGPVTKGSGAAEPGTETADSRKPSPRRSPARKPTARPGAGESAAEISSAPQGTASKAIGAGNGSETQKPRPEEPRRRPTLAEPSGNPSAATESPAPAEHRPTLAELSGRKPPEAEAKSPRPAPKSAPKSAPKTAKRKSPAPKPAAADDKPAKASQPAKASNPIKAAKAADTSEGSSAKVAEAGAGAAGGDSKGSSWQWWRGGGSSGDAPPTSSESS